MGKTGMERANLSEWNVSGINQEGSRDWRVAARNIHRLITAQGLPHHIPLSITGQEPQQNFSKFNIK